MLEPLFNKVADLAWPVTLLKKDSNTVVCPCEYCEILKNTFLEEHLRTAASLNCELLRYSAIT